MPLFASKEQRQAEKAEHEEADRRRGVLVHVESSNAVPALVRDCCDRGWVLDAVVYSGNDPLAQNVKHALMTVVFRWPATNGTTTPA